MRALISVSDLDLIEHRIDLGFTKPGQGGAIIAAGGRVEWMSSFVPDFFATIPDAGVPILRRNPDLRFLELALPDCIGFN